MTETETTLTVAGVRRRVWLRSFVVALMLIDLHAGFGWWLAYGVAAMLSRPFTVYFTIKGGSPWGDSIRATRAPGATRPSRRP